MHCGLIYKSAPKIANQLDCPEKSMRQLNIETEGRVLSLCSIKIFTHIEIIDLVVDFQNMLVFILTNENLLITFNIKLMEIENVIRLNGFFTRLFFLKLSTWLVIVDNRSEITILYYRQKLFYLLFKTNLGFLHLKCLEEYNYKKVILLDEMGELCVYKIDLKSQSLRLIHRSVLQDNQTIKGFLYIPSVLFTLLYKIHKSLPNILIIEENLHFDLGAFGRNLPIPADSAGQGHGQNQPPLEPGRTGHLPRPPRKGLLLR